VHGVDPHSGEDFTVLAKIPSTALAFLLLASPLLAQELTGMDRLNALHTKKPPAPSPIINFNPVAPSEPDTTPVGTLIAQIIVTMTDGSPFTGSLGFGSPYFSDAGICAIQGTNLILGAAPPRGSSTQYCTVTATQ
jgi:hypothetical protein